MLVNVDFDKTLHIIGIGYVAEELQSWISEEHYIKCVLVTLEEYQTLPAQSQCLLGRGDYTTRVNFLKQDISYHTWPTYIHPRATITKTAQLGMGSVVQPHACLGHGVKVGDFGWITVNSHIGHGGQVGRNVMLYPGSILSGSVQVGDNVGFGQGSSVRDKIKIGSDIQFSMSSVVTKDILDPGTYTHNKRAIQ